LIIKKCVKVNSIKYYEIFRKKLYNLQNVSIVNGDCYIIYADNYIFISCIKAIYFFFVDIHIHIHIHNHQQRKNIINKLFIWNIGV
jgi:hypothetical protein